MDVASTKFGTQARDRDDLALQVQNVFKKFLEEYSAAAYEEGDGENNESNQMETEASMRDDVTNDSFSSARSRPQQRAGATSKGSDENGAKYATEALLLLTNERNTLFIDFKDLELFDPNLAEDIICEHDRFYPYLCRALAAFVREERIRQAEAELDPNIEVAQRMIEREHIKRELDRPQIKDKNYYVGFYNFPERTNIRELSSTKVGVLTRVSGQVVRTHSVHPELILGCFKCKDCLTEKYQLQQFRFTPPNVCGNENCANRQRYDLIIEKSHFTDFQRLRIQETQQELPRGCIPRSFDVIVRGADQVECIQPGDQCDFIGILIAVPDVNAMMSGTFGTVTSDLGADSGVTGLKSIGVKEMTHTLAFLASSCIIDGQTRPCINTDQSYRETVYGSHLNVDDFTKEEIMRIEKMSKDNNLLNNLSQSLFSSIYGSEDVKRGIVLQLLGGVPKNTTTGTKLRGDINICLVGDPSTAKSQFLKIVTDFAPVKAVYASGKASSASGLTAAVVRDTDGGFVIEAGALMLADRGICCIDEFDKMDLKDQVALHEAMEQQTISITKAGVSATLNARASILAAANPISGKYDPTRNLKSNVNFSFPIMSRFDLFFTLIDAHDPTNDRAISARILDMHLNYANSTNVRRDMVYAFEDIRLYLRFARKYYPKIPIDIEGVFSSEYVRLRQNYKSGKKSWPITVRQLESLIRLSEAIARAHCDEVVKPEYVRQASKLIENTMVHVGDRDVELGPDPSASLGADVGDEQPSQGMYEGELESQRLEPSQPTQQKIRIPRSTYKDMAEILVMKLRRESDSQDRMNPWMKKSELVDWYLHQCLGEIETEAELIKKKLLCEKVLDRLIRMDNILMEVHEDGKIVDPSQLATSGDEEDRMVLINPVAEIDDIFEDVMA